MSLPETSTKTVIPAKEKSNKTSKIIFSVLLFIAILLFFAARWYIGKFGDTGFDSIIFTIFTAEGGAQAGDIVGSFLLRGLLPAIITFVPISFVLFFFPKKHELNLKIKKFKLHILPISHGCASVVSLVLTVVLIISASNVSGLTRYIKSMTSMSTLFEEKYIDPKNVKIQFPEKKRNLIYIFLESMETTYFSEEDGGGLKTNIIPELYHIANKNINFSHNDGVGGFLTPGGAVWTVAAMTAHTSGVPLKSPPSFERNTYGAKAFLPGLTTLGDILSENGYYQALMVGSDARFANRNTYYNDHGVDKIYDLFTAREDGIVPEGYHVWWGMEDKHLFRYAKKELTKISKSNTPFAFTMLTVDTHFTDGYVCDLCDSKHSEQYDNVISCSSKQVAEFVNWLKRQPFYKDTTIIIAGDHLTMDSGYIKRNTPENFDQRVYNCIINSAVTSDTYKNRQFTSLDMFPTTLAAMGCTIEGDRLGLGTNLFSGKKTLTEEMGFKEFNEQVELNSKFYTEKFINQTIE